MENFNEKEIEEFIKKVQESKKREKFDLSADEDLTLALMNLISIEEHFFFSGAKSNDKKYYDLLNEIRKVRIELMKKIERNSKYEEHCILKHLLAASMRLEEVGTKKLSEGQKEQAYEFFEKSYYLYSLFWGINLEIVNIDNIKAIPEEALNKHDIKENINNKDKESGENKKENNSLSKKEKKGLIGKLGNLVQKIIDCCIE
ncbi:MAG: hypothetical protein ACP5H7_01025 [Minisyncoccia bacterium]